MGADWKRYGLYLIRWQLSTPILAGVLLILSTTDKITATIIANLVGGLIFFWIDKLIFKQNYMGIQWEVREAVRCVDCGAEARGYRIVKAPNYDKMKDTKPEFRCETCSSSKTEQLRLKGIPV